jgi:TRAP transporter 4TM/12TM fusion protein
MEAKKNWAQGSVTEAVLTDINLAIPRVIPLLMMTLIVMIGLFHLFTGYFGGLSPYPQRLVTLSLFILLGLFFYPLGRKNWHGRLNLFFLVDLALACFVLAGTIYVLLDWEQFSAFRMSSSLPMDRVVSSVFIFVLLELGRRCLGWPIVAISLFFLLVNLFSDHLWGWLYGFPVSWKMTCEVIFMQPEAGIFSIPLTVCTNYLVTFLIFVGFLLVSGVDRQFVLLANALAGRYSGGPAKVAVIGSAFVGMMQGAPSANVAATGSFTIPMMKKLGFDQATAGAVESCASTGGQMVPPIMGSTAFIIAAFLEISYLEVCANALIPSLIFYSCVIFGVHFYSQRKGLSGLPASETPGLAQSLSQGWPVFLPFLVLLGLMAKGYGLGLVGVLSVASLWLASSLKKETRLTAESVLHAFEIGAKTGIVVTIACAVVGIIVGTFYVSGLGDRLSTAIISAAGGNLALGLLLTASACIILGMGMVIPAVYLMMVYISIPALVEMGAAPIAAHFFVFMFCVVAAITPPVGLALYVASGISGASVMNIGWRAMRLGIPLFIIPFFIVWDPVLLGLGNPWLVGLALISGLVGAAFLEAGFEGWFIKKAHMGQRIFFALSGGLLLIPEPYTDLTGLALGLATVWLNQRTKGK